LSSPFIDRGTDLVTISNGGLPWQLADRWKSNFVMSCSWQIKPLTVNEPPKINRVYFKNVFRFIEKMSRQCGEFHIPPSSHTVSPTIIVLH
jgi:hypothetical protein